MKRKNNLALLGLQCDCVTDITVQASCFYANEIYSFIPRTLWTLSACRILRSSMISSEPPGIA
jgi:hypothetical protein